MSITISNNRIHITDATGLKTVFDTDTRMPAIIGVITGEDLVFPERAAPHGTITQDHIIATGLGANINFIYAWGQLCGSYGSTGSGSNPYENTITYGTNRPWIPMLGSAPALYSTFIYTDNLPGAVRAITIMRSGTTLIAREQCFSRATAPTPEQSLNYKIFLGVV